MTGPPDRPVVVEQAAAWTTRRLRQLVLRPHDEVSTPMPGDGDPTAVHFSAHDAETGEVVGAAYVRPEPPPWDPEDRAAWRLRGMATAPHREGTGVGAAVLAAATSYVATQGGRLLWCAARTTAVGFYERAGFVVRGEPWRDPATGPHVRMWRAV